MIKKLIKVGDSMALIMDDAMLEHLGVSEGDSVEITLCSNQSLCIEPTVRTIPNDKVIEAAHRLTDKYEDVMRKLAE